MPGKGSLQLTGKLGEVIRESAQIGLSWVKSHAYDLGITTSANEQFLTDRDIHVHMPEGSIGKEGPSAGTAILTAFVSLFSGVRVCPDIGGFLSFFFSLVLLHSSAPCLRSLPLPLLPFPTNSRAKSHHSNDRRNIPRRPSPPRRRSKREDPSRSSGRYKNHHRAVCESRGYRGERAGEC